MACKMKFGDETWHACDRSGFQRKAKELLAASLDAGAESDEGDFSRPAGREGVRCEPAGSTTIECPGGPKTVVFGPETVIRSEGDSQDSPRFLPCTSALAWERIPHDMFWPINRETSRHEWAGNHLVRQSRIFSRIRDHDKDLHFRLEMWSGKLDYDMLGMDERAMFDKCYGRDIPRVTCDESGDKDCELVLHGTEDDEQGYGRYDLGEYRTVGFRGIGGAPRVGEFAVVVCIKARFSCIERQKPPKQGPIFLLPPMPPGLTPEEEREWFDRLYDHPVQWPASPWGNSALPPHARHGGSELAAWGEMLKRFSGRLRRSGRQAARSSVSAAAGRPGCTCPPYEAPCDDRSESPMKMGSIMETAAELDWGTLAFDTAHPAHGGPRDSHWLRASLFAAIQDRKDPISRAYRRELGTPQLAW